MAYSEAARVTENTKRLTTTDSVQTNVRSAVNTFGEAVEGVMSTYSLNLRDEQAFHDALIDLCRYLDACMR